MKSESERKFSDSIGGAGSFTLNQIRKNRKLVDYDVQKLHNRIRMLQLEEERALRKIDETRRKAKNIMEIRLNNQGSRFKRLSSHERPMTPD